LLTNPKVIVCPQCTIPPPAYPSRANEGIDLRQATNVRPSLQRLKAAREAKSRRPSSSAQRDPICRVEVTLNAQARQEGPRQAPLVKDAPGLTAGQVRRNWPPADRFAARAVEAGPQGTPSSSTSELDEVLMVAASTRIPAVLGDWVKRITGSKPQEAQEIPSNPYARRRVSQGWLVGASPFRQGTVAGLPACEVGKNAERTSKLRLYTPMLPSIEGC